MFVGYCKTCKVIMGWGDKEQGLLDNKHSSGEYELVDQLDANGEVVLDEHDNPVQLRKEILHECGVFEIEALPENVSSDDMTSYLETNYADNMV